MTIGTIESAPHRLVRLGGRRNGGGLMKYTYEELAGMIDHSLLHPTMTDRELREGCDVAAKYRVASVCIKPYAVKEAAERLGGPA